MYLPGQKLEPKYEYHLNFESLSSLDEFQDTDFYLAHKDQFTQLGESSYLYFKPNNKSELTQLKALVGGILKESQIPNPMFQTCNPPFPVE